jgi:indole-3-glycerol phosphate synthase
MKELDRFRHWSREAGTTPRRGFRRALASQTAPAVIAELKKASPSPD